MAFWGVELKPGRPYTHTSNTAKGRLHISQATLGIGSATAKSVVQCNVGNKSPVFLCSLFPEKLESCQLNLEFDEADDVVLSVLGPQSVHLTGYYLVGGHHFTPNDESESYGEDIANTESEKSIHSDEEYEDSFIDDGDLEVFSASPISSCGAIEEHINHKEHKNGHRRLRKKYQLKESDEDNSLEEKLIPSSAGVAVLDDEDDDKLPISSPGSNKHASKRKQSGAGGEADISKKTSDDGKVFTVPERKEDTSVDGDPEGSRQDDLYQFVRPSDGVGSEDGAGINTKKKEHNKKEEPIEVDCKEDFFFGMINKEDKSKTIDTNPENFGQLPLSTEEDMKAAEYMGANLPNASLPSTEVDLAKPKKSKSRRKEEKRQVENDCHDNVIKQNHIRSNEKAGNGSVDLPARDDKIKSQVNDEGTQLPPDSLLPSIDAGNGNGAKLKRKRKERESEKASKTESTCNAPKENGAQPDNVSLDPSLTDKQNQTTGNDVEQVADKNQSEEKKRKKKKSKKSRDHGNDISMEIPPVSVDKNGSLAGSGVTNIEDKSSKLRTLSGGLVIKEVKVGKTDGKIAAPGKKISVYYTGKLKNGQIFDSNIAGKPLKFRLGGGEVIEGLNVGLEGMRVGDKRGLEIPPTMGYGSEGDGDNVPPNAWLEYDVELVKVH